MARWLLRASIAASLLLIVAHFAYAVTTFRTLSLASVQFAELGLPLLFAAFLNGVVWSSPWPGAMARAATHLANGLMIAIAGLVAHFAPLPPAYLVLGCAAGLGVSGVLAELSARAGRPSTHAANAARVA